MFYCQMLVDDMPQYLVFYLLTALSEKLYVIKGVCGAGRYFNIPRIDLLTFYVIVWLLTRAFNFIPFNHQFHDITKHSCSCIVSE